MALNLFTKKDKQLNFDRTYKTPISAVWRAWTDPEELKQWWGPEKTFVPECELDLRVGGRFYIVTEAGPEMGKYAGTRWPMDAVITVLEPEQVLTFDAQSWTEDEDGSTIHHTNELRLSEAGGVTTVELTVTLTEVGPKAKLASFGMKYGYKSYLKKLDAHLANNSSN